MKYMIKQLFPHYKDTQGSSTVIHPLMEFDKLDFNASHLAQILGRSKLDEGPNKSTLSWFNNKLLKFDFFVALSSSEMNHKIPSTKPLIINYDFFFILCSNI